MTNTIWVEKEELMSAAAKRFAPTDILLDIGCGIMPQPYLTPSVHICVEPFQEYVDVLKEKVARASDRSYVIVKNTWDGVLASLPEKSVDTVVLADVIEHLDKHAALELLKKTEALARQQILIFTPLGFLPQVHPDGIDAWGLSGGAWQEHKSGWTPDDFGAGWEFVAARQYYFQDNLGGAFVQPFGAFWAIKKMDAGAHRQRLDRRHLTNRFSALAETLNYSAAVNQSLVALKLAAYLKRILTRFFRPLRRALARRRS
jgi:hypothetical protein